MRNRFDTILIAIFCSNMAVVHSQKTDHDSISIEIGVNLFSVIDNPMESKYQYQYPEERIFQTEFITGASFKIIRNRLNFRMDASFLKFSQYYRIPDFWV